MQMVILHAPESQTQTQTLGVNRSLKGDRSKVAAYKIVLISGTSKYQYLSSVSFSVGVNKALSEQLTHRM